MQNCKLNVLVEDSRFLQSVHQLIMRMHEEISNYLTLNRLVFDNELAKVYADTKMF